MYSFLMQIAAVFLALTAIPAFSQAEIPQDLREQRERTRGKYPLPERLEACTRLVPEAATRLAANDSWRLRVALDCADTEVSAGEPALALKKLDVLLEEIRGMQTHPAMEIIALKYHAMAMSKVGRKVEAVQELERALELAQQRFADTSEHAQDVGIRLCGFYANANRFDDAISLCSRIVAQRPARGPAGPADILRAHGHLLWGSALVKRGRGGADLSRGIELLETSVRELELNQGKDGTHVLQARRELANALLRSGQQARAEEEVRDVRERFARIYGEKHPEVVTTDALLRIVLVESRQYQLALDMGSKGQGGGDSAEPTINLNRQLTHAVNLISMRKNDEALEALVAWAQAAEAARDGLVLDAAGKAQFTRQWSTGYQFLAIAYSRKSMWRQALVSLELSKARSLLSAMSDLESVRGLDPAQRAVALKLMRDAALQRQRQRLAKAGTPDALEASRLASSLEFSLGKALESNAQSLLKKRIDRDKVESDIVKMVSMADDGDAYLSLGYGLGGSQSLMPLLLRRSRIHAPARPLVIEHNLEGTVAAMRMLTQHGSKGMAERGLKIVARRPEGFQVVATGAPEPAVTEPRQVVQYLSDKLIGPFRMQLQGVRRLVISADGPTWLIPFDLLELNGQPLFMSMTVSYTPSASVLAVQRQRLAANAPSAGQAKLFAVGGASYQKTVRASPGSPLFITRVRPSAGPSAYDLAALSDAKSGPEFFGHLMSMIAGARDLPGSLAEVRAISARFSSANVTTLVGDAASEKRIDGMASSNGLAGYDYLHFATHSIAQTSRPLMSAILTSVTDRDGDHDGYITAQEISSWNLNARLVVLSACDTAIGANLGGDGILGLPFAFLAAGAATTLQTLWPIPDAASAAWMDAFYAQVMAGATASDSLTAMKRQVALESKWQADYAGPTPWAAFAIYGQ